MYEICEQELGTMEKWNWEDEQIRMIFLAGVTVSIASILTISYYEKIKLSLSS